MYVHIYTHANSRDRHEKYGFPKKTHLQSNMTTTFSFKILPYNLLVRYAISAINPFKQLKRILESKLSNFKIFENY